MMSSAEKLIMISGALATPAALVKIYETFIDGYLWYMAIQWVIISGFWIWVSWDAKR